MEEKKPFGEKLSDFFAGKGFYIVLLLCAALIATSIWLMTDGSRADVGPGGEEKHADAAYTATGPEEHPGELPVMRVDPPRESTPRTAAPAPASTMSPASEETVAREDEPPEEAVQTVSLPRVDYFIWPVNGALLRPDSTQVLRYDATMADWRTHSGWDIAAPQGERVLCTANGVVSAVYSDDALGTVVEVEHQGGLVSVYANLAEATAAAGQTVSVGSVLGTVGRSALYEIAEPSHLHFAIRLDGQAVDPAEWLPRQ